MPTVDTNCERTAISALFTAEDRARETRDAAIARCPPDHNYWRCHDEANIVFARTLEQATAVHASACAEERSCLARVTYMLQSTERSIEIDYVEAMEACQAAGSPARQISCASDTSQARSAALQAAVRQAREEERACKD